ncbi:MAG: NADAR family protein [Leptospiraceae bacterium]|nr:NADAR family protein [Leptospiraceae bacterium]MCP5512625.1 NADAR family protein [Leptospiraceae bacterium]
MKYDIESLVSQSPIPRENFVFFWGHSPRKDGRLGPSSLSQWWMCRFEYDGFYYSSTEQWMMAQKALLFGDHNLHKEILNSQTPKIIKDLGRKVSGFQSDIWNEHKFDIVKKGNYLKFSQNVDLSRYLRSTRGKILVEASPFDSIWGIGLSQDVDEVYDPKLWKGKNLLGFALMEVRDELES